MYSSSSYLASRKPAHCLQLLLLRLHATLDCCCTHARCIVRLGCCSPHTAAEPQCCCAGLTLLVDGPVLPLVALTAVLHCSAAHTAHWSMARHSAAARTVVAARMAFDSVGKHEYTSTAR
jgi:hypothetical protein